MYLHKQKKKNGDIYLSIKEKYHVPKVGSRERTVESIGYLSKRELLRLSLRLEVGASCFNHYCPADTLRYHQVLHNVHKRWVRPVPDLPYIIYATENPDFSILRPSRLIFMAAFRSRLIVRPQSHTIVRFARFFISG